MTCLSIQSIQHGATCANSRMLSYDSLRHRDKKSCMLLYSPGLFGSTAHSTGNICFHLPLSQGTVCLRFFLTIPARNTLHSMHNKSLKLQPSSSSSANGHAATHEENGRNHEDLLALLVAFNAEAMHQPRVLCPSSNLSACCDSFSSKPLSVKNQARTGKKSRPLLHLLLLMCMNCQDDHNTTLHSATSSSLTPMSWETILPSQLFKLKSEGEYCS